MLILKLGGAAITDKSIPNTAHHTQIERIAAQLAAHQQPMVLVHGAGSFGHILAKEYRLQDGYQDESQRAALIQLQQQLHELNSIVVDALIKAGVPAMTVHPASMCVMRGLRIDRIFVDPLQHMLNLGIVPVLYGDCVWDLEQGFGILSGDQLVIHLANELEADRVAFGTNVAGVLDSDGGVIARIDDLDVHIGTVGDSHHTDVTGGMRGKLNEIADIRGGARLDIRPG